MNGIDKKFTSIQQVTDQYLTQKNENVADAGTQVSFEEVLRQKNYGRLRMTQLETYPALCR